jgi:replication-associated recombination protein RarA
MSENLLVREACRPLTNSIESTSEDVIVSLKPFYKYGRNLIGIDKKKLGYSPYDLGSALHKDIRRGNEYEALFWAVKLESLGKKGQTRVWNELKEIASEDLGPANPMMPVIIETLEKQYLDARKRRSDAHRLFLTNAVVILARSGKSRIVDDLLNIVYGQIQHEDKKLPIPDYALDMHTSRGKRKGRSYDYFFSEGNKLGNEVFENPYTLKAKEILIRHGGLKSEFKGEEKVKDISKTEKTVRSLETFTRVETLPLEEDTQ